MLLESLIHNKIQPNRHRHDPMIVPVWGKRIFFNVLHLVFSLLMASFLRWLSAGFKMKVDLLWAYCADAGAWKLSHLYRHRYTRSSRTPPSAVIIIKTANRLKSWGRKPMLMLKFHLRPRETSAITALKVKLQCTRSYYVLELLF